MCHNTMLLGLGVVYTLDYVIVWKCSMPSTRAKWGDVLVFKIQMHSATQLMTTRTSTIYTCLLVSLSTVSALGLSLNSAYGPPCTSSASAFSAFLECTCLKSWLGNTFWIRHSTNQMCKTAQQPWVTTVYITPCYLLHLPLPYCQKASNQPSQQMPERHATASWMLQTRAVIQQENIPRMTHFLKEDETHSWHNVKNKS